MDISFGNEKEGQGIKPASILDNRVSKQISAKTYSIRSLEQDFQTGCQAIFVPTLPVK